MDNFSRGLLSLAGNDAETSITVSLTESDVVYFDQLLHAWECICMVENDKNAAKPLQKCLSHHARIAKK